MLVRLPILASLATLATADFHMYWFSENVFDPSAGASSYGGVKFFAEHPNCDQFINGKFLDVDFDGDVSDASRGGYTCDGCDENVNWEDWRPGRIEINDFNQRVFTQAPYHITLYGNGDGSYTVMDTEDRIHGSCSFVADRVRLNCDTEFGPYRGIEALQCYTSMDV